MSRKNVLYFMPDNPVKGFAGNISRSKQLLSFFTSSKDLFSTDFVSERIWGNWDSESENAFHEKFPDINLILINRKYKREDWFNYVFKYKIPNFFSRIFKHNRVDITTCLMRKNFKKVLKKKKYDIIIISYAQWGNLIDALPYPAHKIIDTHDFISFLKVKDLKCASAAAHNLKDEISILKKFQNIWTFSIEEKYIFGQFTQRNIDLIPVGYPIDDMQNPIRKPIYDLIYVASNNPHNIKGIEWFVKEVLPLLKPMKIAVIGKIKENIPDHPFIHKLGFVDDLNTVYRQAKISICPMMSGTGIKIKVLESLAMGLPVVTNTFGVTGLINKINSGCLVTDKPELFSQYIHQLLEDDAYRLKVAKEGQELMQSFYNLELEKKILLGSLLEPIKS